eukprot:GSMAST32.ASY1.ANO1.2393.1 assembled CDS
MTPTSNSDRPPIRHDCRESSATQKFSSKDRVSTPGQTVKVSSNDVQFSTVRYLAAGGLAGCFAKTIIAPLERARILAQTGGQVGGFRSSMIEIFKTEGVSGFWRGNGTNCLRVLPNKGFLFMANDCWKNAFRSALNSSTLDIQYLFLSGSLAGMTATLLIFM